MKHTTIALILLIISQLAHSQQIIIHNDNEGMLYMPNNFDSSRWVNCDTIQVVMLVSDTVPRYYYPDPNKKAGQLPFYNQGIFWIKGYEVKEYIPAKYDKNDLLLFQHWETIEYLDENKKVLSKNIIVWMTK